MIFEGLTLYLLALPSQIGWASFFFITFLTALPGLWLLWWLRSEVSDLTNKTSGDYIEKTIKKR